MEALQQLHWQEFVSSLNLSNFSESFTQAVHVVCDNSCLVAILDEPIFNEIYSEYEKFCTTMNSNLPHAKFWNSYIYRNGIIAPVIYMSNM